MQPTYIAQQVLTVTWCCVMCSMREHIYHDNKDKLKAPVSSWGKLISVSLCCPWKDRLFHGVTAEQREKESRFPMLSTLTAETLELRSPLLHPTVEALLRHCLIQMARQRPGHPQMLTASSTCSSRCHSRHHKQVDLCLRSPCRYCDSTLGFTPEPSSVLQVSLQTSKPHCTLTLLHMP